MADLAIENLSKRFPAAKGHPDVVAISDLNLACEDGELLVIVGPSGSGKTTLLRLIAGLDAPDKGVIRIKGDRVDQLPPEERNVAMVFQSGALYPHMTVGENLASGLKWRGARPDTFADKVAAMAKKLGLQSTLDRLPEALSGGERQRAALGRSALLDPELFLLDEPLAHLDANLRHLLRREIRNLNRSAGTTLIHVTHDQSEAMSLGDRIAVMKDGEIQQIGAPTEIYDTPANTFVAQFFGSRPMNLLEGTLLFSEGRPCFQRQGDAKPSGLALPANPGWSAWDKQPALLGIRPEHFSISRAGEDTNGIHDNAFEDTVRLCEYAGDAQYLTTESGLTIKAAPSSKQAIGDALRIHVDTNRCSIFAADSGVRID